jgi:cytochrome c-type biogenesis protein CcmE
VQTRNKFVVGSVIIIATLAVLGYTGYTQSKTYYHTISELSTLDGMAAHQRLRVSGNVQSGSIAHLTGETDFVLEEQGKTLKVAYTGRDPLPDTFKDGAQALVEGRLEADGRFQAEQVQAKCASKYQASPMQGGSRAPASQTENGRGSGAPNGKS